MNIILKDMDFTTGTTLSGLGVNATITLNSSGTGTFEIDNVHAWYNGTVEQTNAFWNFLNVGGANLTLTANNFGCDYCYSGFGITSNATYTDGYIRHPAGDVLTLANACNFTMSDIVLLSPQGNSAVHPDFSQIKDGATICSYDVKRIMAVQGGGNLGTQGIYFGGGPNNFTGYIDDGSGTGTPGKVLTKVGAGGFQAQSNGSQIYSTYGSPLGLSDSVVMNCPAGGPYNSNCNAFNTADLNLASNVSIGSPGSPVQFYGVPDKDGKWDMVVSTGFYLNGLIPASIQGTSYHKHYAHVYQTTVGATPQAAPHTGIGNCNLPDWWTGTFQLGPGMEYDGIGTRQGGGSSSPCPGNALPASITVSNVLQAGNNTTTVASYYANGNPKDYLEALSTAQWDALSIAQVKAYVCKALTPTVSGPLDLGGGDWANPFNASGQWVDGTAVPGC